MARRCVLAGWRPHDSGQEIKGDNILSVNMVRQFTFNIYSYIVDVNKDLIFF